VRRVVFLRSAAADLVAAARYYEVQQHGLGEEFRVQLGAILEQIILHPLAGVPVDSKHRKRFVRGFPYSVIYTLSPGRISIRAVAHLRRNPDYWKGRT